MSNMVAQELVRCLVRPMPIFQLNDQGASIRAAADQGQQRLPEYLSRAGPRAIAGKACSVLEGASR